MKKYRVNVNGTDYEITLEEVTGAEASKPAVSRSSGGTGSCCCPCTCRCLCRKRTDRQPNAWKYPECQCKSWRCGEKGTSFADFGSHDG